MNACMHATHASIIIIIMTAGPGLPGARAQGGAVRQAAVRRHGARAGRHLRWHLCGRARPLHLLLGPRRARGRRGTGEGVVGVWIGGGVAVCVRVCVCVGSRGGEGRGHMWGWNLGRAAGRQAGSTTERSPVWLLGPCMRVRATPCSLAAHTCAHTRARVLLTNWCSPCAPPPLPLILIHTRGRGRGPFPAWPGRSRPCWTRWRPRWRPRRRSPTRPASSAGRRRSRTSRRCSRAPRATPRSGTQSSRRPQHRRRLLLRKLLLLLRRDGWLGR